LGPCQYDANTQLATIAACSGDYSHTRGSKDRLLPVGEYVLLASVDVGFGMKKNPMARNTCTSPISVISAMASAISCSTGNGQAASLRTVQQWCWSIAMPAAATKEQREPCLLPITMVCEL